MWRSGEQIYPVDDPFQQRIRIYKGLSGGYAGRSTAGSDPPGGCRPDSPEANAYEEERRLYYVGMTRAKEQLYIFTFGPNMTSVFSGEVLKKPKERQILPGKSTEKHT